MNYPDVTILVAARNEEDNVVDLLKSIEKLNYPKDKLQVLVGNDASTDATEEIITAFISGKPYFNLINVDEALLAQQPENILSLKGKARVLAIMSHHATGDFYFYTDADVELPVTWVETMLSHFELPDNTGTDTKPVGVVVGITIVKATSVFTACQALEWIMAISEMKLFSVMKIATTGMGNNMAVRKEAYWENGGYETIGFSIVEDYALYRAVIDSGYPFVQTFVPGVLAHTKPPKKYFEQRKRWFRGGMESRSFLIVPIMMQALALPAVVILGFFNLWLPLYIVLGVLIVNLFTGTFVLRKLRQTFLIPYLPVYTVYMFVFWFFQLVYYILPTKLVWKDRTY